ncbi:ATP-dependent DNA ligase [Microbacterium aureliae]
MGSARAKGSADQLVSVGGRRLRVTNLDKVMYPATGTTKGEVIEYYTRIAPVLLPHIAGRPVTRKRWVEGVGTDDHPEPVFFAKDLEPGAPAWVPRMPIPHSSGTKHYPLVEDVATLVYLAQVASLELHVPQWRFTAGGERGDADRLVLDLDPGPGTGLAECAVVAEWARTILSDMGLEPFPVTSGSKGIHLYAALPPGHSSEQASALAKELARAIEADHPDLVVSSMKKTERAGRVLIDWSQNNGAKTTIAPYSLRGRSHPAVAAPRTWQELADPGLRHLTFDEVLGRAASGDPLAALGEAAAAGSRDADGPLAPYIAKRSAARTPEPVPEHPAADAPAGDAPIFVIQEHHASRLHWDFRLERDGVLVSWAVPRGVPPTPRRNSLAIMTEDHPMSYATFEGTIPAGEYGGGTVTIWDAGHYELEKWRDDEVIATLEGRPGGPLGRVRLALIRTAGEGEKSSWLLHRMKTDAAGRPQPDAAPVVPHPPSPRSLSERSETRRTPSPPRSLSERSETKRTPPSGTTRPMLATAATPALARIAAERWARTDGGTWAEAKWDGIRAIGVWDGARLRLFARSGNELTHRYPELTATDVGFGETPAVIDGELVALEPDGRPSFPLLQTRMNLERPADIAREAARTPVRYYLFDILARGDRDLTALPLRERREELERLAAATVPAVSLPPVFDDLDAALETSERLRLEGVVVKDPAGRYESGRRSESWLKVKHTRTQEVVIAGMRPGRGGRAGTFGSLLVGIPDAEGTLRYAGRVGTGFSDRALTALQQALAPLRTDRSPLADVPSLDARDAVWVRPELVGEVEFAEFTPGSILRHARWRGLRPDKTPDEVVRES